ncbi:hypothetical protein [Roseivirga misakiensis]|uniref:Uncharacterized protein n=1 Tax=Roseivirga misakiensis TaxID=1563681 RepID=A0A1E5SYS9_9BACT|nr:hypothetical protein [Roseivirga misakiensis]OEK04265.1 hypothetical protein BFP71_12335 [Roseivirga misakiensis]
MLTSEQLSFISSKRNFQIKNEVDEIVGQLLYDFQHKLTELLESNAIQLPTKVSKLPGKISKGNNHKGYPFQVSDFPANFSQENIFTFRSTIWYGNFFSFALIVSGIPKNEFDIQKPNLQQGEHYFSLNETVWDTHFDASSASLLTLQTLEDNISQIKKSSHLKIFRVFEMNQIHSFNRLGIDCFKDLFATN